MDEYGRFDLKECADALSEAIAKAKEKAGMPKFSELSGERELMVYTGGECAYTLGCTPEVMDKDDLLLIIVNSGRTWNVLQNAMYAKERGIKIIEDEADADVNLDVDSIIADAGSDVRNRSPSDTFVAAFDLKRDSGYAAIIETTSIINVVEPAIIKLFKKPLSMPFFSRITLKFSKVHFSGILIASVAVGSNAAKRSHNAGTANAIPITINNV